MTKHLERGQLRDALLAEVKAICAEKGPEAVSIAAIGKKLGVSSGAPFRLFPSRTHIFVALVEQDMKALKVRFEDAQDAAAPCALARIDALCHAYLTHARQEPAMFRLSFSLSAKAMGSAPLQTLGETVYGMVHSAVRAVLPPSAPMAEAEAQTYLLWSTIHGHAMLTLTGQTDDQGISITDNDVVDRALAHLQTSAPAPR